MSNIEQTLSIIKPDAAERNLDEKIKSIFRDKGFKIIKERKIKLDKSDAETFYKVHETKPFYNDLCNYLSSGPIVVMALEKEGAVAENRKLMGATDPKKAENGTLRKQFGISIDKNSVHGSDSLENAKIELEFFLKSKIIFSKALGYNLCSSNNILLCNFKGLSFLRTFTFFCKIILPESSFGVTK